MFRYDKQKSLLRGPRGCLPIPPEDVASRKFAMLVLGECTDAGPTQAAKNFGFSRARYYQLREAFLRHGTAAMVNKKSGPKGSFRRTPEVTKRVIRARFLDPEASPEVIASKLRQDGYVISSRSVERIISDFGLQK